MLSMNTEVFIILLYEMLPVIIIQSLKVYSLQMCCIVWDSKIKHTPFKFVHVLFLKVDLPALTINKKNTK